MDVSIFGHLDINGVALAPKLEVDVYGDGKATAKREDVPWNEPPAALDL